MDDVFDALWKVIPWLVRLFTRQRIPLAVRVILSPFIALVLVVYTTLYVAMWVFILAFAIMFMLIVLDLLFGGGLMGWV
jgi:hypothetical protein